MKNINSILSNILIPIAVLTTSFGAFLNDSTYVRRKRFEYKFGKKLEQFNLKKLPYVPQSFFVSELELDVVQNINHQAGVRIIWGSPGAGKTTTVKMTLNKLFDEGKIAGCIYITPPDLAKKPAAKWFEDEFNDSLGFMLGKFLKPGEKPSKIIKSEKPYVIVLDRIEGSFMIDQHFEALVRTLAYDSDSSKAYIVLLITSDPDKAAEIYGWNGGTKITFLGHHKPWKFKWTFQEIDTWIHELSDNEKNVLDSYNCKDRLINEAIKAGTPAFLVHSIDLLDEKHSEILNNYAILSNNNWEMGQKIISNLLNPKNIKK